MEPSIWLFMLALVLVAHRKIAGSSTEGTTTSFYRFGSAVSTGTFVLNASNEFMQRFNPYGYEEPWRLR